VATGKNWVYQGLILGSILFNKFTNNVGTNDGKDAHSANLLMTVN